MRLRKPSAGVILGTAALVAAVSGSAVAASLITSRQIKDGTIQLRDISRKARAQLKGDVGLAGPVGPRGAAGPAGAPGDPGPPGPVNVRYVAGPVVDNANGTQATAVAECPPSHPHVIGGGVHSTGFYGEAQRVNTSGPGDGPDADTVPDDGWVAAVDNDPGSDAVPPGVANDQIQAIAICTSATSVARSGRVALRPSE